MTIEEITVEAIGVFEGLGEGRKGAAPCVFVTVVRLPSNCARVSVLHVARHGGPQVCE